VVKENIKPGKEKSIKLPLLETTLPENHPNMKDILDPQDSDLKKPM
jgi:hypothetical protein